MQSQVQHFTREESASENRAVPTFMSPPLSSTYQKLPESAYVRHHPENKTNKDLDLMGCIL